MHTEIISMHCVSGDILIRRTWQSTRYHSIPSGIGANSIMNAILNDNHSITVFNSENEMYTLVTGLNLSAKLKQVDM